MIEGIPIGVLSASGLAALAVLSVIRGWLIPARQVDERVADVKRERDQWREAHAEEVKARGISEQARMLQSVQIGELLENSRTTAAFIRSLPRPPT